MRKLKARSALNLQYNIIHETSVTCRLERLQRYFIGDNRRVDRMGERAPRLFNV